VIHFLQEFQGLFTLTLTLVSAVLIPALRVIWNKRMAAQPYIRAREAVERLGELAKIDATMIRDKERMLFRQEQSQLKQDVALGFACNRFEEYFTEHFRKADAALRIPQRSLYFMWWLSLGVFLAGSLSAVFFLAVNGFFGNTSITTLQNGLALFAVFGFVVLFGGSTVCIVRIWRRKLIQFGYSKFVRTPILMYGLENAIDVLFEQRSFEQLERHCNEHRRYTWIYAISGVITGCCPTLVVVLSFFARIFQDRSGLLIGGALIIYAFFVVLVTVEVIIFCCIQSKGCDPYRDSGGAEFGGVGTGCRAAD
jgi:hypothetical protein